MVRHRHKEDVVSLGGLGQDLLEAGPLVWPEATADAILEVGATARHLKHCTGSNGMDILSLSTPGLFPVRC